jgi:hypothetical protein
MGKAGEKIRGWGYQPVGRGQVIKDKGWSADHVITDVNLLGKTWG